MIAFLDDHRGVFGVGPICRVLGIAPSTFYSFKAVERDPTLASDRARQDQKDMTAIKQIFDGSRGRYGARKVWHQLRREGCDIARCTVERLMKVMGLQGVVRGKKVVTTNPDAAQPCPDDKVNRVFVADMPNQLWVSDFTYVSSWQGMVYVAFVIDVFARKIVGWRVSTSMTTGFVLDALNQAICQRAPSEADKLIHHSDRGSQYLSIRYTERLAEAGIDTSVGSVGDSYDNALAESIIGLFKTECIRTTVFHRGPYKTLADVVAVLDEGRIAIAALATGAAQGCVDESVAYAKQRTSFGQKIGQFQAVSFKIARMQARAHAARLAYYEAAQKMLAGKPFKTEAAMAKLIAGEAAMDNARDATQVFGGYGFMNETLVARHYRDSKILEVGEGTTEVQLMLIARELGL